MNDVAHDERSPGGAMRLAWLAWGALCVTAATAVAPGCAVRLPAGTQSDEAGQPCQSAMECPQPSNPCLLAYCEQQQCVHVPAPEGPLPEELQRPNDCVHVYCDGQGQATGFPAAHDLPADDGNPCTVEQCVAGKPQHAKLAAGEPCPEGFCTEAASCGECRAGSAECAGAAVRRCSGDGRWSQPAPCPPASPLCDAARCVGLQTMEVGADHACARFDDGSLRCWGAGGRGQLGSAPGGLVAPGDGTTLESVSVGVAHACGVDASGKAWCWGSNRYGQLGDGSYEHREEPVPVELPEGTEVSLVRVGRAHSCALDAEGSVWCWGRNDRGQLGRGTAPKKPLPPLDAPSEPSSGAVKPTLSAVADVSELRLTGSASCVRTATSPELRCWGLPRYEPPGDKEDAKTRRTIEKGSSPKPARVEGLTGVDMLGVGAEFGCALAAGAVACWGANGRVQLGTEPPSDRFAAAPVPSLGQARDLAVGEEFACALSDAGEPWCWGANDHGQLGRPGDDARPSKVAGLEGLEELRAGDRFACGFGRAIGIRCWGEGGAGQLGAGDRGDSPAPRAVAW